MNRNEKKQFSNSTKKVNLNFHYSKRRKNCGIDITNFALSNYGNRKI